jgi:PmbA protein
MSHANDADRADDLLGQDAALALLHGAVASARDAGADDAEVSLEGGRTGFTRFAGSYFTQAGTVVDPTVRVRVVLSGRVGAAQTSQLDTASLKSAARAALEVARAQVGSAPPASAFPGFARPDPARPPYAPRFSPATAAAGPDERADACARLFARAARDQLVCAGAFKSGVRELATVTAGGVAAYATLTEAGLELIALDADPTTGASGYAHFHGGDLAGLDVDALAEAAVERAVRARDAIEIEPGPLDVVFEPPAVAELLEWMAMTSFSARSVLDQGSFLAGRSAGEPLASPALTIADDGGFDHPSIIPQPFDAEGVTRVPVAFIRAGAAGRPCSDLATAHSLGGPGAASTGHASGLTNDLAEGAGPAHLVLHPGEASVDELCGRVERGLRITRFHYVNGFLDTRRATMTGMTRDGTFLIENGTPGRAVRNLRWTESILDALSAARLGGIGRELRSSATSWTKLGQVVAPALLLRGFRFTGRSR